MIVPSTNPKILYAIGESTDAAPSLIVFISKNAGATWTSKRLCAVMAGQPSHAIAVNPRNAKEVIAGGYKPAGTAVLYKSKNGGNSWTDIARSIEGMVFDIKFDPRVANRIYVVASSGIYRTDDGGESWTTNNNNPGYHKIIFHPTKADMIYAGGENGIIVSVDGGVTWSELNSSSEVKDVLCLEFNRLTKVLYAGTGGGGVYKIQQ